MSSDLLSLTNPVLYAGSAVVVTVVALLAVAITFIRQRRMLNAQIKIDNDNLQKTSAKSYLSDDIKSNDRKGKTKSAGDDKTIDNSSIVGKWPTELGRYIHGFCLSLREPF